VGRRNQCVSSLTGKECWSDPAELLPRWRCVPSGQTYGVMVRPVRCFGRLLVLCSGRSDVPSDLWMASCINRSDGTSDRRYNYA